MIKPFIDISKVFLAYTDISRPYLDSESIAK